MRMGYYRKEMNLELLQSLIIGIELKICRLY